MLEIAISDEHEQLKIDQARLRLAAERVLAGAGLSDGELSIAVVDDATIQDLNRRYLGDDRPTDVLSFLLERDGPRLEGEVVVSAETAARSAPGFGWSADDELLLYVIHGVLHLVGFDDQDPQSLAEMRGREGHYLRQFGVEPHDNPEP